MSHVYNVLFLCTGNSARSILAEAIMNRLGEGKFAGYSAGSIPRGEVHPAALALLEGLHYSTEGLRSKSWEEFSRASHPDAPEFDFIFTVCDSAASESCPVWPGQPITAHWGIPDPAAMTGSASEIALAFAEAYHQLEQRIGIFLSLPLGELDRMALQHHLDAIGRTPNEPKTAA